ncbi:unnamed protein product, partial [Polarella glacialis]
ASSVSNDVSFEELRWMQRQKPQDMWEEAAQAASECPALAEEPVSECPAFATE